MKGDSLLLKLCSAPKIDIHNNYITSMYEYVTLLLIYLPKCSNKVLIFMRDNGYLKNEVTRKHEKRLKKLGRLNGIKLVKMAC